MFYLGEHVKQDFTLAFLLRDDCGSALVGAIGALSEHAPSQAARVIKEWDALRSFIPLRAADNMLEAPCHSFAGRRRHRRGPASGACCSSGSCDGGSTRAGP